MSAHPAKKGFHHPTNPLLLGTAILQDAGLVNAADESLDFNFCHFGTSLWLPDALVHAVAAVTVLLVIIQYKF